MFHWESVCLTFSRCHISSASTGYKCWGGEGAGQEPGTPVLQPGLELGLAVK